jgi:membrane glycosyltransferase
VIRATRRHWHHAPPPANFAAAVVDPIVNALLCAQAAGRTGAGRVRELMNTALAERALHHGIDHLTPAEKNQLLADPAALSALHWAVWTSAARHDSWRVLTEQQPARARTPAPPASPVRSDAVPVAQAADLAGT